MKTLLQLNTSLFSNQGQSSLLASRFVENWKNDYPEGKVIVRDMAIDPVPHLDAGRFAAFSSKVETRTVEQQNIVDYSDNLINELKSADVIVLGLPLYNFGVPSILKAYIDHITRAGSTFRYTAEGPVGFLTGKKAFIFAARGGKYAGTSMDTQTDYIKEILGFIGITDVEFVYAEGLAMGEESKQKGLAEAHDRIVQLSDVVSA